MRKKKNVWEKRRGMNERNTSSFGVTSFFTRLGCGARRPFLEARCGILTPRSPDPLKSSCFLTLQIEKELYFMEFENRSVL